MGYYEYVENAIIESGLDESVELLDILESAETVEDLEAIEEYLTEKEGTELMVIRGRNRDDLAWQKDVNRGRRNRALMNASKHLPSIRDSSDNSSGRRKQKQTSYQSDKHSGSYQKTSSQSEGPTITIQPIPEVDENFEKVDKKFNAGQIAAGATLLLAATAGIGLKLRSVIKKINSTPAKKIEAQLKALEKQAKVISKKCKAGDITEKEARLETKKIRAQYRKLSKEAERIAREDAAKATNESVDIDDIQDDIFDAFESGEIDEDEVADLLELLDV